MSRDGKMDRYVALWWIWFTVALFMLVPLDLLTTLFAVAEYGMTVEANPVMRLLLEHGLLAVTMANIFAAVLVVVMFHSAIGRFRQSSPSNRRLLVPAVSAWVLLLNVAGFVVVANNLSIWF